MPLQTKRWSDPVKKNDGFRLLISTARPSAVAKDDENWHEWYPELGPSKELQTAYHGKSGTQITWEQFRSILGRDDCARRTRRRLGRLGG